MSRIRSALVAAVLGLLSSTVNPVRAEDYVIDGSHTSVIFGISHLGYSFTYGRFNKVSGVFSLDPAKPEASKFELAIDASSIDTNDAKRDEHLKSADFFSAGEFPAITFKSTKVAVKKEGAATAYTITGDLTMHGVTKPFTLENVQKLGEGPGPTGQDFRTGFHYQGKLSRSEFGMAKMVGPIGDEVAITISFEGVRQDAAAPATGRVAPKGQRVLAAKPVAPATAKR